MTRPEGSMLPGQMRALMLVVTLCLLAYVALLIGFSAESFPTTMVSTSHWPFLMDKPVGEDGFYMLTVAANIATHGRIMYNHGLPATGIQPLATMVFAGLDWLVRLSGGGPYALIRSVMGLGALLFVLFACQVRSAARAAASARYRHAAGALAFLLTLCSFTLFRLFLYGLETGFYLVLIAGCFLLTQRIAARGSASAWDTVQLGLFAGLAGEARIDFGLLFAIILCFLVLYRWLSGLQALAAGALALLVVSPWFLFVHAVSGSWLPSSGKAESTWITWRTAPYRLLTMVQAVAGEVMPWCYGILSYVTVTATLASVVLLLWLLARNRRRREVLWHALRLRHSRIWFAALFSLLPVYVLFFNASHFYYRYVAPVSVLMIPVCAVVLTQAATVRRHMVAVTAALAATFAIWATAALHTGRLGNSQAIAAGYIHRNFSHAHVGSFQSGVVGFFDPNVDNLDGKLNPGALAATQRGELPQFIDQQGIDVLVDWPGVIYANLPWDYLQREWQPCPVPVGGGAESICLQRKSSRATGG